MIALTLFTALAFEAEVAGEVGSLHFGDPEYDLFTRGNALPSVGVRAGFRPRGDRHFPVGFVASWHHNTRGSAIGDGVGGPEYVAAFTTDTFGLGARLDADIGEVFSPYVAVQGLLMRGRARFDDDADDPDSPGQTAYAGVAPGLLTVGGVELSSPNVAGFAGEGFVHLEIGYGVVAPLALGDLGSLQPRGVAVRAGTGFRFGRSGR